MASTLSKSSVKDLITKMDESDTYLSPYRDKVYEYQREFLGTSWTADPGNPDAKVYFNYVEMHVQTYARNLTAIRPYARVSTPHRDLKPRAKEIELGLAALIRKVDAEKSFRMSIYQSIFSLGIIRMGIGGYEEEDGEVKNPGMPFLETVSFDDWGCDMSAKRFDQVGYTWCRYRMLRKDAIASPLFSRSGKKQLAENVVDLESSDSRSLQSLVTGMDRDSHWDSSDMAPECVILRDVWLPRECRLLTLIDGTDVVLRDVKWTGPKTGPFRYLWFNPIPDSPLPYPPVAISFHGALALHSLGSLYIDETLRYKKLYVFNGDDDTEVTKLMDAESGDAVPLRLQSEPGKEAVFGGHPQGVFMTFADAVGRFSHINGNLDSLGGLGPQSETASQDRLINESASQRMRDMRVQAQNFYTECIKDLAFYLLNDPDIKLPIVHRIPELGLELEKEYSHSAETDDFLNYNFEIDLLTDPVKTSADKLNELMQFAQLAQGLGPMAAQQGYQVDFGQILMGYAELTQNELIRGSIKVSAPVPHEFPPIGKDPKGGGGLGNNKPNGRYERINRTDTGGPAQEMRQAAQMMQMSGSGMEGAA